MTPAALWLRWKWYALGAGVLFVLAAAFVAYREQTAVWRERAAVADSVAKVEQRNRLRNEQAATAALSRADSLEHAVTTLTTAANRAAHVAAEATQDAMRAERQRDAASVALRGAQTQRDSVAALVEKSDADDSLIRAHERTIAAKRIETDSLRAAIDSGKAARVVLAGSIDSLRAQLRRDGVVIQQLQGVISTARPTTGPRVTRLALTAGVGYCAAPSLTPRVCAAVVAGPSVRLF